MSKAQVPKHRSLTLEVQGGRSLLSTLNAMETLQYLIWSACLVMNDS